MTKNERLTKAIVTALHAARMGPRDVERVSSLNHETVRSWMHGTVPQADNLRELEHVLGFTDHRLVKQLSPSFDGSGVPTVEDAILADASLDDDDKRTLFGVLEALRAPGRKR